MRLGTEKRQMKRPNLWKDIAIVLAAKLVLLTCLYVAFFSPSHRIVADTAAVSDRLLGTDHR
jgi:archaellum component FlaF (FlaF/FlaG flagellin family)